MCTYSRVERLLKDGVIVMGGESDKDDLYIAPTLITDVKNNDAIMEDEVSDTSFTCGIVLTYHMCYLCT